MQFTLNTKINLKLLVFIQVISAFIAFYVVSLCILDFYQFFSLRKTVEAKSLHLSIIETPRQEFKILADYSYLVDGKEFNGKDTMNNVIFNNPYQAKKVIEETKDKNWLVFYRSQRPEISRLQKEFSVQTLVRALLGVGVFIYFTFASEFQAQKRFKKTLNNEV